MAETTLPDLSLIWSSAGDILKPSDSKIQQGWQAEIPPRQWFNWLDNRQDQAIAHIAQHGIAVWSDTLEYQAGKSYIQGLTNSTVYRCVQTHTNQNPETDLTNTFWTVAFVLAGDAYTKAEVDSKTTVASVPQSQAWSSNTTLITPLRLAEALKGVNQSLGSNGFQKLPGGLILQWLDVSTSVTGTTPFVWPIAFTSMVRTVSGTHAANATIGTVSNVTITGGNSDAFNTSGNRVASNLQIIGIGY